MMVAVAPYFDAHVLERRGAAGIAGMMIDRDVGARNFVAEERRLHIDHRDLVEGAQVLGRGRLDFDFQHDAPSCRFSGRVTGLKANSGVVCLLRPSRVRRAIPLDIASGSGSSCSTIATRSPSPTIARNSLIFCLVSA